MSYLRRIRKELLNLTQSEMGQRIGVHQSIVSRAENDPAQPLPPDAFTNIQRLLDRKGCSKLPPSWYFEPPSDGYVTRFINRARSLVPESAE